MACWSLGIPLAWDDTPIGPPQAPLGSLVFFARVANTLNTFAGFTRLFWHSECVFGMLQSLLPTSRCPPRYSGEPKENFSIPAIFLVNVTTVCIAHKMSGRFWGLSKRFYAPPSLRHAKRFGNWPPLVSLSYPLVSKTNSSQADAS